MNNKTDETSNLFLCSKIYNLKKINPRDFKILENYGLNAKENSKYDIYLKFYFGVMKYILVDVINNYGNCQETIDKIDEFVNKCLFKINNNDINLSRFMFDTSVDFIKYYYNGNIINIPNLISDNNYLEYLNIYKNYNI